MFEPSGDSGDQAASTHRHQYRVERFFTERGVHLETDRSLPRDDVRIVVRGNERQPAARRLFPGGNLGLHRVVAHEAQFDHFAVLLGEDPPLRVGHRAGEVHDTPPAEQRERVSRRPPVIPRGRRDDSLAEHPWASGVPQDQQLVQRASDLERARSAKAFELPTDRPSPR